MPMSSIKLRPGVQADWTPTYNEAGITSSNLIRFFDGLVQKLGGWTKFYGFPIGSTIRALLGWSDLRSDDHLGVGAEETLSVITDDENKDITPQTRTSDVTPDFTTAMGSDEVIVEDTGSNASIYDVIVLNTPISIGGLILQGAYPIISVGGADTYTIQVQANAPATEADAGTVPEFTTTLDSFVVDVMFADHGLTAGDTVAYIASTLVGGLTIQGLYTVFSVSDADNYVINASEQATSTATEDMNGGDAQIIYYVGLGPPASGSGFGVGDFGEGGFGSGLPIPSNPGTPITATDWTLDNWGEIFLACATGGPIYYWSPSGGFQTATIIPEAPLANGGIFVAMPQQILVAWGASVLGIQDPLLVAWSDSGDFFEWGAASTNLAGTFRLSSGSKIVGGIQAPRQALLWTDIDLWSMQYVGLPQVFNFTKIASGCGAIGPHSMGTLQGTTFWMGSNQFYVLSGNGAQDLPCPVWDVIFQDLDLANVNKIRCAPNSSFNEIAWYYPSVSGGTGENDKYVKFNTDYGWDYGTLDRTAWIDQSVLGQPIGSGTDDFIYQHETSNDADGLPLISTFTTGYSAIDEGESFPFIDFILPDMRWGEFNGSQDAAVILTLNSLNYPGDTPLAHGPYTLTQAKQFINTRLRSRLVSVTLTDAGSPLGTFWRMGNIRYRVAPSGRR